MGVELHIRKSVLEALVHSTVQQQLNTTCVPALDNTFIDHLDVTTVQIGVVDTAVNFKVHINVFVVDLATLEPGGVGTRTPPGALTPLSLPTPPSIELQLLLTGTTLEMTCTDVRVPAPRSETWAEAIRDTINEDGPIVALDLATLFTQMDLPAPSSSRVFGLGPFVVFGFDISNPSPRLSDVQEWGVFVNCDSLRQAAGAMVDPFMPQVRDALNNPTFDVGCASNARLNGRIRGVRVIDLGELGSADVPVELFLAIAFVLSPALPGQPTAELQTRVSWRVDAHPDVGFFERVADSEADDIVRGILDAERIGAIRIDDHSFMFTQALDNPAFGDSLLRFESLTPIGNGSFLLGGSVSGVALPEKRTLEVEARPFARSYPVEIGCRGHGAGIQGLAASTWLLHEGSICSIEILSPTRQQFDLQAMGLFSPTDGTVTVHPAAGERLFNLGIPIRILIRTSRGVRIVNYGIPPDPRFDHGNVTNTHFHVSRDCLSRWRAIDPRYLLYPAVAVKLDLPNPPPTWIRRLHDVAMFEVSITRAKVEQAGEVLILDQPLDRGKAYFTANEAKEVLVPIMTPLSPTASTKIRLSKLSQADVGTVTSQGKTFHRLVTLSKKDALSHHLSSDNLGAIVTSTFPNNRVEATRVTNQGIVKDLEPNKLDLVAPKLEAGAWPEGENKVSQDWNSKYDAPSDASEKWKSNISGVKTVHYIPGFEEAPVAVAGLDDGTYRLLTRTKENRITITGVMQLWPHFPPVAGSWAISGTTGNYVSVYRVIDMGKEESTVNKGKERNVFDKGKENSIINAEKKESKHSCGCKEK
ncbi:hypothetical protein ACJ41O_007483 [Fusarium nematophilum]